MQTIMCVSSARSQVVFSTRARNPFLTKLDNTNRLEMERNRGITITKYSDRYYNDIIQSGYPFNTYLRAPFYNRIRNLLNWKEIQKFVLKTSFFSKHEIVLIAFSRIEKKAIGIITLRKITEDLWGIWDVFVLPQYRGMGVASLLYQASFRLLRENGIGKAVGVVSLNNIASIKSIKKNWQGFFSRRIFLCRNKFDIQVRQYDFAGLATRKFCTNDRRSLFEIYRRCVGEEWCSFFEIDQDNYLHRIFGSAYIEALSENLFTRLAMENKIFVAEYKEEVRGYAIFRRIRLFHTFEVLHLFVPAAKDFYNFSRSLLFRAFKSPGKRKSCFAFVGNESDRERVRNLGLEVEERLVPYKYL